MKKIFKYALMAALVVLSASCKKDGFASKRGEPIRFFLSEIQSKGDVMTADLLRQDGLFGMNAILDEKVEGVDSHYINHLPVEYVEGSWTVNKNGQTIPWVPDVNISFWGYYPYECRVEDPEVEGYWRGGHGPMNFEDGVMSFLYSSPRYNLTDDGYIDDVVYSLPVNFSDLLLAYTDQNQSAGRVPLKFKHALAVVQFDLSPIFAKDPGFTGALCGVDNIFGEGICSFDPKDSEAPISWSTFPRDPNKPYAIADAVTRIVSSTSECFFVVPQTTPADATLAIELYSGLWEPVMDKSMSFGNMKWEAGKIYKYRLNINTDGSISFTVINGDLDGYRYQGSDDELIIIGAGSETDGE